MNGDVRLFHYLTDNDGVEAVEREGVCGLRKDRTVVIRQCRLDIGHRRPAKAAAASPRVLVPW
jgi:hypothetical protein